ncbi:hypothetical protein BQ8794_70100 [Mesorhizobium prunaredense]|uniref:SnoaL-like domain-containing protein n=2 Tax=Mesorhizobium prunaredense TaxID=1631249 RepID=A0A1R3VIT1_9HYPH|nr:hypothetical protein BQ8794_70100 [Mesorhizobium prunaredense]
MVLVGDRGGWGIDPAQNVIRDAARDLPLAHDDQIGAELLQVIHFGIGMRAGDDLELWIEDVQLDVVSRLRMRGKADVSTYFGNYDRISDWTLSLGSVDGRPAILIRNPQEPDGAVRGFMLVEWQDERVVQIRDFRYAPWCLVDAEISTVEG